MAARLKAATAADPAPPRHRESFESSIAAMTHLTPEDDALVNLGRTYARQLDEAQDRADLADRIMTEASGDPGIFRRLQKLEAMCDVTKTAGWLGPQLRHVLADLSGQPSARKAPSAASPSGSRLAEIRNAAATAAKPRRVR